MFYETVGLKSNKVKNVVERGMVKRFAESIGEDHPLFIDEDYGKQTKYGQNIAPVTFPRVFDYGEINDLYLPNVGLIHGEQVFYYERPLLVGEELICYTEVGDYYEKKSGNNGLLGFIVLKRYAEDSNGKKVFTEEQTVIITEAVRKELVR